MTARIPTPDASEPVEQLLNRMATLLEQEQYEAVVEQVEQVEWFHLPHAARVRFIELLSQLPFAAQSSKVKDGLIILYAKEGQSEVASALAHHQVASKAATFDTYLGLAILAEKSERTYDQLRQYMDLCALEAKTPEQHFILQLEECYYWILQLDPVKVLEHTIKARQYVENKISRLTTVMGYEVRAYIMMGDFNKALDIFNQVNMISNSFHFETKRRDAQDAIAEGLKDIGEYAKALNLVETVLLHSDPAQVGYALYIKAAILCDQGRYQESLECFRDCLSSFTQYGWNTSRILPLVFIPYLLFKLGAPQDEFARAIKDLRLYALTELSGTADQSEAEAFIPLALGIEAVVGGDKQKAVEILESVRQVDGYDAVLLAWLHACQLRFELGTLAQRHVDTLVHISRQRVNGSAATLGAYGRREYRTLLEHCVSVGWHAEFFQAALRDPERSRQLQLHLLTDPPTISNGTVRVSVSQTEALTLYYLMLQRLQRRALKDVTSAEIARAFNLTSPATANTRLSRAKSRLKASFPAEVQTPAGGLSISTDLEALNQRLARAEPVELFAHFGEIKQLAKLLQLNLGWFREKVDWSGLEAAAHHVTSERPLRALAQLLILLTLAPHWPYSEPIDQLLTALQAPRWVADLVLSVLEDGGDVSVLEFALMRILRENTLHS